MSFIEERQEQARQEEIYLNETEEVLRMILELTIHRDREANFNEQRGHAAEELTTGDSNDPPLSEVAIEEMIRAQLTLGMRMTVYLR